MIYEAPDAINGWRVEAEGLCKTRGWRYPRALDHVLVRYLLAGDLRPLLDLICNLARKPGRRAGGFISAITDGTALLKLAGVSGAATANATGRFRHCRPAYEIRISLRRVRGRPTVGPRKKIEREICARLLIGCSALAEGKTVPRGFWPDFAAALDSGGYKQSSGKQFPFKAELVSTGGGNGRRRDPEIETRDKVLHDAVAKKVKSGLKYDAAVADVQAEFEASARKERVAGKAEIGIAGRTTIRAAYDKNRDRKS